MWFIVLHVSEANASLIWDEADASTSEEWGFTCFGSGRFLKLGRSGRFDQWENEVYAGLLSADTNIINMFVRACFCTV